MKAFVLAFAIMLAGCVGMPSSRQPRATWIVAENPSGELEAARKPAAAGLSTNDDGKAGEPGAAPEIPPTAKAVLYAPDAPGTAMAAATSPPARSTFGRGRPPEATGQAPVTNAPPDDVARSAPGVLPSTARAFLLAVALATFFAGIAMIMRSVPRARR